MPFLWLCLMLASSLTSVVVLADDHHAAALSIVREYHGNGTRALAPPSGPLHRAPISLFGPRRESHLAGSEASPRLRHALFPCLTAPRIERVSVDLGRDTDHDGYFPFFTLHFTPRGYCTHRKIFARLFLSFEGGPWNLLYRTHDWEGGNSRWADPIILDTRLQQHYPTGFYDLLIEFYDADDGHWLLSEGPYEDPALRSIPLEAESLDQRDSGTEVAYAFYGTGSIGAGWLFLIPLAALRRRLSW